MFWLGKPSNYDASDDGLDSFPEGDLGGRYQGLVKGTSPQDLFDTTMPMLLQLHYQGIRKMQTMGTLGAESVFCQGIQMTWIFASTEINRLQSEIDDLKKQIQELRHPPIES